MQVVITVTALVLSCLSWFFWKRYRYTIRAVSFAPPFFINIIPMILGWFECQGEECILSSLPYHACVIMLTFLTVFPFVNKMPECLAPGKFDIFFQSHQLFPVSTVITTTNQMKLLLLDNRGRQEILTKMPSKQRFSLLLVKYTIYFCLFWQWNYVPSLH